MERGGGFLWGEGMTNRHSDVFRPYESVSDLVCCDINRVSRVVGGFREACRLGRKRSREGSHPFWASGACVLTPRGVHGGSIT